MDLKNITVEVKEGVAILALNRPAKLNAIDEPMLDELNQTLPALAAAREINVLVLTGAGRAFCAGGDFRFEDVRAGKSTPAKPEEESKLYKGIRQGRLLGPIAQLILNIHRMDKPTVAMINGDAVGAGLDMALACDLRVASNKARFAASFVKIGLTADTGSAWFLPRLVGLTKAMEYILSGDLFDAGEALRVGLLNKVVAPEELEKETLGLARRLARGPSVAQKLSRMQLYKGLEMDLESALGLAAACLVISASTEDHKEGVRAFAEKRPPAFKGK